MGIQGLHKLVCDAIRPIKDIKEELSGQTAVIDGYAWIYKGCYFRGDKIYFNEDGSDCYVKYVMNNLDSLIASGLKPIMVFDGMKLPAKEVTTEKRRLLRQKVIAEAEALMKKGQEAKAREKLRSTVAVTQEMARKVIAALREKNIQYIVAPFEADAQMAYLVANGYADLAITEDSDLILFGVNKILFKFKRDTGGELFEQKKLQPPLSDLSYLRRLCIISGCDYLPSLDGVGLAKARNFLKAMPNFVQNVESCLKRLPTVLGLKKVAVTDEYIQGFARAEQTFMHQLVFCPAEKTFVPLNPLSEKSEDKVEPLSLDTQLAFDFALGNVDHVTQKVVDHYRPKARWMPKIWKKSQFKKRPLSDDANTLISIKRLCCDNPYDLGSYISDMNSTQSSESGYGSVLDTSSQSQATQ
ncbi:Exonuclease 1 [Halotydeus destructor]|nr:Exonuclease 1 [Halotydeus destructor]